MKPSVHTTAVPVSSSLSMPVRIASVRKQVAGIARILSGSDNRMVGASAEILDDLAKELTVIEQDLMQEPIVSSPLLSDRTKNGNLASSSAESLPLSADNAVSPKRSTRGRKRTSQMEGSSPVQPPVLRDSDVSSPETSVSRPAWNDAEILFLRTCPSSNEAIRLYHLHFGNLHNDSGIHQRWLKLKRVGEVLLETDVVEVTDDDSAFFERKGKIISWTDSRACANVQFTGDSGSYQIPVQSLRTVLENDSYS